ncbi:hypothetical protein BVI1335_1570004 [Burkholderia vietnamiensis]|nr:hypothetical protein BVI1335_1570004 [Burkholderia vietnamiensis]
MARRAGRGCARVRVRRVQPAFSGFRASDHRRHRLNERVDDGAIAHSEWTRASGRGVPP